MKRTPAQKRIKKWKAGKWDQCSACRDEGRRAYRRGALLAYNPYEHGTVEAREWARGWRIANRRSCQYRRK